MTALAPIEDDTRAITFREIIVDFEMRQCGLRLYFGLGIAPYTIRTVHDSDCGWDADARICTCGALPWPKRYPRLYRPMMERKEAASCT